MKLGCLWRPRRRWRQWLVTTKPWFFGEFYVERDQRERIILDKQRWSQELLEDLSPTNYSGLVRLSRWLGVSDQWKRHLKYRGTISATRATGACAAVKHLFSSTVPFFELPIGHHFRSDWSVTFGFGLRTWDSLRRSARLLSRGLPVSDCQRSRFLFFF